MYEIQLENPFSQIKMSVTENLVNYIVNVYRRLFVFIYVKMIKNYLINEVKMYVFNLCTFNRFMYYFLYFIICVTICFS